MNPTIDLARFGIVSEQLRGTVVSHSLSGRRLLFLFGERHTIRAGIKAHLLNALTLFDSGVISCVGVEGWKEPSEPVPCETIADLFNKQKAQHGNSEEAVIEGVLRGYRPNNYVFWKCLTLLRLELRIRSVENPNIFQKVGHVSRTTLEDRISNIATFLRHSALPFTQMSPFPLTDEQEQTIIQCKATSQAMEEFAEDDLNYQRDEGFIANMRCLWDEAGPDKPAILNAGVSHQYRIARQLREKAAYRDEYSYILIEQP